MLWRDRIGPAREGGQECERGVVSDARRFFEVAHDVLSERYVRWIEGAKRPETRAKRIEEAVSARRERQDRWAANRDRRCSMLEEPSDSGDVLLLALKVPSLRAATVAKVEDRDARHRNDLAGLGALGPPRVAAGDLIVLGDQILECEA